MGAPTPDYVVTGDLSPDATGNYYANGDFGSKTAYERADGSYWIYWSVGDNIYFLSTDKDPNWGWFNDSGNITGSYAPFIGTTGTATVTVG